MRVVLLALLFSCVAALSAGPAGAQCVPPTINGDMTDMIAYAQCFIDEGRCAFIVDKPVGDLCPTGGVLSVVPCGPTFPGNGCGGALTYANGADMNKFVIVYVPETRTLYAGIRINSNSCIGDVNGDGDWGIPNPLACDALGADVPDETGIGSDELYRVQLDIDCSVTPGITNSPLAYDIAISVQNNAISITGAPGAVPSYQAFNGSSDLEIMVTNIDIPSIWSARAFSGFVEDGISEDMATTPLCQVTPEIDVLCAQTNPTQVCAGTENNFAFVVENLGDTPVQSLELSIDIPDGLTFVTTCGGSVWDNVSGTDPVVATLDELPFGESATLCLRLAADADCVGPKTIDVSADGQYFQAGCADPAIIVEGSTSCPVTCIGTVALRCALSGPDAVCANAPYDIIVDVYNDGTGTASGVQVRDPENNVVCSWASIGPGGHETCTDPRPASNCTGDFTLTYGVSGGNVCGPSSNTCEITLGCDELIDVVCAVEGPAAVCAGTDYTNTITVTNNGAGDAGATDLYFVGEVDPICHWDAIAAGQSVSCTDERTAPFPCGQGSIVNQYTVLSDGLCNDTDSDCEVTIECDQPSVDLVKSITPTQANPGEDVTVTIEITNDGTSDLEQVGVCDHLPEGLTFDQLQTITTDCGDVGIASVTTHPADNKLYVCFDPFSLAEGASCTIEFIVQCADLVTGAQLDSAFVEAWCTGTFPDGQKVTDQDSSLVECTPPGEACPRTPGFWRQQCRCRAYDPDYEHGPIKYSCNDMDMIVDCIMGRSEFFNQYWASTGFDGFCQAVWADDPPEGMPPQLRQTIRQFAALLANTCAGDLEQIAGNGDIVSLPEDTPILDGCNDLLTVGEVIDYVDQLLLDDPSIDQLGDAITCMDDINNALNIPFDALACVPVTGDVFAAFADSPRLLERMAVDEPVVEEPQLALYTPSPNPFSGTTRLAYEVPAAGADVRIAIYDADGRVVRTLQSGFQAAGVHTVAWDGRNDQGDPTAAGVYFYRAVVGGREVTRQIVIQLR